MKALRILAVIVCSTMFAALSPASELIPQRPIRWLVHFKIGSPTSTTHWAELSETGAIRISRKKSGEKNFKKIHEGNVGAATAGEIYDLTAETVQNFRFPERDPDTNDGTNVEWSLIFHHRALTVEFLALEPTRHPPEITALRNLLNSRLPENIRF